MEEVTIGRLESIVDELIQTDSRDRLWIDTSSRIVPICGFNLEIQDGAPVLSLLYAEWDGPEHSLYIAKLKTAIQVAGYPTREVTVDRSDWLGRYVEILLPSSAEKAVQAILLFLTTVSFPGFNEGQIYVKRWKRYR